VTDRSNRERYTKPRVVDLTTGVASGQACLGGSIFDFVTCANGPAPDISLCSVGLTYVPGTCSVGASLN